MKTTPARLLFIISGLLALALLNGCALTKDHISLSYVAQTNVSKINGADSVSVRVAVNDIRSIKDKVSVKKNGYGMEMAAIIAKEDVADTLKKAIEVELANRGFRLSEGGATVATELSKFYSDFKVGFWSGSALAEVIMSVQVKNADGSIVFSKLISGEGGKERLQLATGSNAKVALDAALRDAVSKLVSDSGFVDALIKTAKP